MSDPANRCTCEGGHVLLCPEHAEEAMGLLDRLRNAERGTGPSMQAFQDEGEPYRQQLGIDGTAGDAQDVPHAAVEAESTPGGCVICGLSAGARVHETARAEREES